MVVDIALPDARGLDQRGATRSSPRRTDSSPTDFTRSFKLVGVRATGPVSVDSEQWITALQRMDIANLDVRVTECVSLDDTMSRRSMRRTVRYLGS